MRKKSKIKKFSQWILISIFFFNLFLLAPYSNESLLVQALSEDEVIDSDINNVEFIDANDQLEAPPLETATSPESEKQENRVSSAKDTPYELLKLARVLARENIIPHIERYFINKKNEIIENTYEQLISEKNIQIFENIYQNISEVEVIINVSFKDNFTTETKHQRSTGLIYGQDGLIIANTSSIKPILDNNQQRENTQIRFNHKDMPKDFTATFIGSDSETGISLLRAEKSFSENGVAMAPIEENKDLAIGQMILAVGSIDPAEKQGELKFGSITGINHEMHLENGNRLQMIETNIFFDNSYSGGAIVDLSGKIIAVINAYLPDNSGYLFGYGVSAKTVLEAVEKILEEENEESNKVWLGIITLNENDYKELQAKNAYPDGIYINKVIRNSPAYVSDLHKGDIITKLDGEAMNSPEVLFEKIRTKAPGERISLTVYRVDSETEYDYSIYLKEYY